jgi:hypothetical protein
MPYELRKFNDATSKYKVCKSYDKNKCFSKKLLSKKQALKQKFAIEVNERRKIGMGRSDSISPSDYNRYRNKYLQKIKSKYPNLVAFSIDDFTSDFDAIYNSKIINVDDTIDEVVEATKKYYDLKKQTKKDTDDKEEKVKSRSASKVSTTSNSTITTAYEDYLSKVDDYNGHLGELKPYDEDIFRQKYMEIDEDENGNLDVDDIITRILDQQVNEIENDPDINEAEDLTANFVIYQHEKDDEQLITYDQLTNKPTSDLGSWGNRSKINFNDLKKLYEFMKDECKKDTKKKLKAFFVNCRPIIDGEHPENEDLIKAITGLCRNVTHDQTEYGWCVDRCSSETYGWNSWYNNNYFAVVAQLTSDDKIRLCAGAYLTPEDNNLYIRYLCGSPAFPIFNEFRNFAKSSNNNRPLWPSKKSFEYLDLGAISNYLTVQFYFKQGMLDPQSHISNVMDTFSEIVRTANNGELDSPVEYAEKYLPYFQSGKCDFDDQYMNEIFQATECGGKKYLFPDLKVELGDTIFKKYNDTFVSHDYLNGFENFLKDVIANPDDWTPADSKEKFREALLKLPAIAREKRTQRLRTKRIVGNKNLPVSNLRNKKYLNDQVRKLTYEVEPNDKTYNKPTIMEGLLHSKQRQEKTRLNRLKGNEPRTKYKRMEQLREFGMPSIRNVALDPFETGNNLVKGVKNRRTGKFNMVEPPQLSPFSMEYIINDRADPRPEGSGVKGAKFDEELRRYGINPADYLKQMKKWAKASGYDEKQLTLDNNDKNKLRIMTEQGTKHFGRVGYKDYYIYKHLEKKKEVKKGYAKIMRDRFRKSHGAISKKRNLGRNSANELSLRILWHDDDDETEAKKKGLK